MNSNTSGVPRSGEVVRGTPPRAAAPPRNDPPVAPGNTHVVNAVIVDEAGGPVSGAKYEVVDAAGAVAAQGTTGWQGTVNHVFPQAGRYTVRVTEMPGTPAPPAGTTLTGGGA